jgi:hypothetical protein
MAQEDGLTSFFALVRALWALFAGIVAIISELFAWLFQAIAGSMRKSRFEREERETLQSLSAKHDTATLQAATLAQVKEANFPHPDDFIRPFVERMTAACKSKLHTLPVYSVFTSIGQMALDLYELEELHTLNPTGVISGAIDRARYRDKLLAHQQKLADPARTADLFTTTIVNGFLEFARRLPQAAFSTKMHIPEDDDPETSPTVPVEQCIGSIGQAVEDWILAFNHPNIVELNLFAVLRTQLLHNAEEAGAMPTEYTGDDLVHAYLKDTPLARLFDAQIPFTISISKRLEHTAVVAGTGWGKTQLLQAIIARDLELPDPPAIVVIDSTNRMVERIQHLQLFNDRLKDRIIIVDPERSPAPALNMFDLNTPRMAGYTPDMRERVETDIIALFNYVFSSIQNPLTDPMRTAFSYMVRLLITVPNANITTLRKLLEDNPKAGYEASAFKEYMERLDPTARDFFRLQFFTDRVRGTRDSILQRLSSVISVPTFERMFSTANKLDFYEEMQRGSCVLVNTSEAMLKDASPLFGRYIIARVMAAAFERAALPDEKRRPAFLIVDEAAPYFDDQFEKLLTRVRQFRLGVVIAFQHLEQASEKLRSAIASNTSVKYAGGLGYSDSRWLSREMRTTPETLLALRKDSAEPPQFTSYACHLRGTASAISLTVPFYTLEKMPRMSAAQHDELLKRNMDRISYVAPAPSGPPAPSQAPPSSGPAIAVPPRPANADTTASELTPGTNPGEPASEW